MQSYKIHIPPVPKELMVGELKNILIAGVERNPRTQRCEDIEVADYVFLDFRHLFYEICDVTHPEKTIIIDYLDRQRPLFQHPSLRYFKRSVVDRRAGQIIKYKREVTPIGYCVKDDYVGLNAQFKKNRDIDIAVFFNPHEKPETARNYYRASVTQLVKNKFGHLKVFVGIAGKNGEPGRSGFQQAYFEIMARAKIVVTCNPDRWEGDNRLFEALSSGSLVLTDKMLTPTVNPFISYEHLVYYDKDDLNTLVDQIGIFMADDAWRREIARNGNAHAMKFHTSANRIDEILAKTC